MSSENQPNIELNILHACTNAKKTADALTDANALITNSSDKIRELLGGINVPINPDEKTKFNTRIKGHVAKKIDKKYFYLGEKIEILAEYLNKKRNNPSLQKLVDDEMKRSMPELKGVERYEKRCELLENELIKDKEYVKIKEEYEASSRVESLIREKPDHIEEAIFSIRKKRA